MTVRANGVETVGKEGTEEREIGVPVRCRAVSVLEGHGVETGWEGGYGGARERNSAQVSSGDGEGKWGGNSMGRRLRRSARSEFRSVSSGDGEGKWGGNSWEGGNGGARDRSSGQVSSGVGARGPWGGNRMGRRLRRSARTEFRSGVER